MDLPVRNKYGGTLHHRFGHHHRQWLRGLSDCLLLVFSKVTSGSTVGLIWLAAQALPARPKGSGATRGYLPA